MISMLETIAVVYYSERQLTREAILSLLHNDSQSDLLLGLFLIDVINVSYDSFHVFNSFLDRKYGEQFQSSLCLSL